MLRFDEYISTKLDGWADGYPAREFLATLFAKYMVWAFFGATIVCYPAFIRTQEGYALYLLMLFVAVGAPHVFSIVLSFLIRRKRPYERMPDAWHLPIRVYTPSFPSGHSTIAFATVAFFIIFWHPVVWIAILLAVLASSIALARVLVGVHYVTDILAGALIGTCGAWFVSVVFALVDFLFTKW